jgi:hypothetical protein
MRSLESCGIYHCNLQVLKIFLDEAIRSQVVGFRIHGPDVRSHQCGLSDERTKNLRLCNITPTIDGICENLPVAVLRSRLVWVLFGLWFETFAGTLRD